MRKQSLYLLYFLFFFMGISSSVLGQEVIDNPPELLHEGSRGHGDQKPYVDYSDHVLDIQNAYFRLSDEGQRLYLKLHFSYINHGRFYEAYRGQNMALVYEVLTAITIDDKSAADLFINEFVANGTVGSRDEFFEKLKVYGDYDTFVYNYQSYPHYNRIKLRQGKHNKDVHLGDAFDKLSNSIDRFIYYRVVREYLELGMLTTGFIAYDQIEINRVVVAVTKDNPKLGEFLIDELVRLEIASNRLAVFQSMAEDGLYDQFVKALSQNDDFVEPSLYAYNSNTNSTDTTDTDVQNNKITIHYDLLTSEEQEIYSYILEGLANAQDSIYIPIVTDSEAFSNASDAVFYDHPEFVWFKGGYHLRWNSERTIIEPSYNSLAENHTYYQKQFEDAANEIVRMASQKKTLLEQERFVFEYLVSHTAYAENDLCRSAYGALVMGQAVCSGFAYTFLYIMHQLGIPAYNRTDETHTWVVVQIDGTWYNVNPTTNLEPGESFGSQANLDRFVNKNFNMPIDAYLEPIDDEFPNFRLSF